MSYMCQCQLSGSSLPREAETPPCAATVCERVGNTLDNTATCRLASASCSAARSPEPPAPTGVALTFEVEQQLGDGVVRTNPLYGRGCSFAAVSALKARLAESEPCAPAMTGDLVRSPHTLSCSIAAARIFGWQWPWFTAE